MTLCLSGLGYTAKCFWQLTAKAMWSHSDVSHCSVHNWFFSGVVCQVCRWDFIYKWANRRADDSFHAHGEHITVNSLQPSGWAVILCHTNKVILLCSDQEPLFHSSCQRDTHGEVCQDLIGVEFAVRVWRSDSRRKTIGSTAALSLKMILPTHHMYNSALRWICFSFQSTCQICCIRAPWERYICSWLYSCTLGPLYRPWPSSIPLPNKHAASLTPLLASFSLSSLGG